MVHQVRRRGIRALSERTRSACCSRSTPPTSSASRARRPRCCMVDENGEAARRHGPHGRRPPIRRAIAAGRCQFALVLGPRSVGATHHAGAGHDLSTHALVKRGMRTDLFDFELPPERIALRPVVPRDAARLLVVRPGVTPEFEDRGVRDLPDLLRPGDALVVNDTKVIPARLRGRRIGRGGRSRAIEATLHRRLDGARWRAFVQARQAAGARRRRALRRRRQGVLPRPARRHRRGQRRGRRGDARLRVPRAGARPGDRGTRRHAAAALHRLAARA